MKYQRIAGVVAGIVAFAGITGTALAATTPAHDLVAKPHADTTLKADLDKILSDPRLAKATSDVDVRTAAGASLYASSAVDSPVRPASNAKLFTTTTALDLLGTSYRFSTTVGSVAPVSGSTLRGDLVLRGTGDPTVSAADYDTLAAGIASRGIKTISGKLLADDTYFDSQRWNPHWDDSDKPFAYASEISALTVATDSVDDTGAVQVTISPAAQGKPAAIALSSDTGYVKVSNKATTGAAGSANTIAVDRPAGANTVVVTGSIPAGGAAVVKLRTVEDPALYVASIFRAALAKHGVSVTGQTAHGTAAAGSKVLATKQSAPLSDILTPYLKLSNNGIADILTKTIGKRVSGTGSWAAGTAAIKQHITALGVNTTALSLYDGSGLSDDDRASAHGVADLLVKVRSKSWFPTFYAALPIAGQPDPLVGGTLAARMAGTKAAGNVHAKTGTLTGATSLSGYVTGPDGQVDVFSILLNNYVTPTPTDLQDRIAVRLATGSAATSSLLHAPAPTKRSGSGKEIEPSWAKAA
ncbi:D-alanyl-D-alanine carboxypeptidase/D-alanyl-D-alanine endopeptidase [Fodinicola feengrottensis]|uniref:D-alanyl-D-alanine carboxypeptidase/D-alanyl-D-alanine-endopeptidase n=1 Tax=Fodinicola feengrottensis TaxID=435914 RepID=A0ABN2H9Q2_9ACTN|nr:D-alanyl-D-alanine carboxypeptidase/D-alanyl-D-alanine-endopeptidase [Fodinicola feengrottensis]